MGLFLPAAIVAIVLLRYQSAKAMAHAQTDQEAVDFYLVHLWELQARQSLESGGKASTRNCWFNNWERQGDSANK